jgi:hypothetical protein
MTLEEKSRAPEVQGSCLAKARGRQKGYFRFFNEQCASRLCNQKKKKKRMCSL